MNQQEEILTLLRKGRVRLNPPLAPDAVRRFEARHRITLPREYVWFITTAGNGYDASGIVPGRLMYPLERSRPDQLSQPFPLEAPWFFHTSQCRHPESEPQYQYDISADPEGLWKRAQWGCLTLAAEKKRNLPLEQTVFLVVNGAARGQIWTLDLNTSRGLGNFSRLGAMTFLDWLAGHLIGYHT